MNDAQTPNDAQQPQAEDDDFAADLGDKERIGARARLLPEEAAVGASADAELQARVILDDSDRRTEFPDLTGQEPTQTPDS